MTEICQKCVPEKKFDTKQKLYSHIKNYHTFAIKVLLDEETIIIENIDVGYRCPFCEIRCLTIVGIKKHIISCYNDHRSSKITPLNFENYDENDIEEVDIEDTSLDLGNDIEDTFEDNEEIIRISPVPVIPSPDINDSTGSNSIKKTYSDALDYCCKQIEATDDEKKKTHFILDTLNLQPFSIIDQKSGIEFNAFTNKDVISQISNKELKCLPIVPTKRYLDNDENDTIKREPSINA